ncbi:hypothetical protein CXF77_01145 [Planococcus sp. MB-3u-09]|nr:hypothetical protein CXF77_01145 [Planococcus sp. MB-3u-09]
MPGFDSTCTYPYASSAGSIHVEINKNSAATDAMSGIANGLKRRFEAFTDSKYASSPTTVPPVGLPVTKLPSASM